MKKMNFFIVGFLIIQLVLLVGCSKAPVTPEGRWINKTGEVIIFGSNNDVVVSDVAGTYSIFDEENVLITLDTPIFDLSLSARFEVESDRLILTNLDNGDVYIYYTQEFYDAAWKWYEGTEGEESISPRDVDKAVKQVVEEVLPDIVAENPDMKLICMEEGTVQIDGSTCVLVGVYEETEENLHTMGMYAVDTDRDVRYIFDDIDTGGFYVDNPELWEDNGNSILDLY